MSWVFLAGDRVYKLKKPVSFPYLDFSTLERREARRAGWRSASTAGSHPTSTSVSHRSPPQPAAFASAAPVHSPTGWWSCIASTTGGSSSGCCTTIVFEERRSSTVWLRRSCPSIGTPALSSSPPGLHLCEWSRSLATNCRVLSRSAVRTSGRPGQAHRSPAAALPRRMQGHAGSAGTPPPHRRRTRRPAARARLARRPGQDHRLPGVQPRPAAVDPFDEIAFLRSGVRAPRRCVGGPLLQGDRRARLRDDAPRASSRFYTGPIARRLRARLAIGSPAEPKPRAPEKWPDLRAPISQLPTARRRHAWTAALRTTAKRRAVRPSRIDVRSHRLRGGAAGSEAVDLEHGCARSRRSGGTLSVMTTARKAGSRSDASAAPAHEQPVGHQRDDLPGAALRAARAARSQRAAGADQVVDDEGGRAGARRPRTGHRRPRRRCGASPRSRRRPARPSTRPRASRKQLGPLHCRRRPATPPRGPRPASCRGRQSTNSGVAVKVLGAAAEGVLERSQIVHVQRHHRSVPTASNSWAT